jgi:hypothetical protein
MGSSGLDATSPYNCARMQVGGIAAHMDGCGRNQYRRARATNTSACGYINVRGRVCVVETLSDNE